MNANEADYEAIHARYVVARKLAHAEARRQLTEEWERRGVPQPRRRVRLTTRKARLIRAGILAARDPELYEYVDLAPRLVRWAARREAWKIYHRNFAKEARAEQAERIRRFHA